MISESVTYSADGLEMIGRLTRDPAAKGPRPGVLVFPEAFGLGAHAIERGERLTREFGYVALACDLHGGGQVIAALDKVRPMLEPLRTDAARVRARTLAPFEWLRARPEVDRDRIGAIGFCFGGTMAFELALAGADLRASVGFHSGLAVTSPQDASRIRGQVLALIGADDPGIPPDMRAAFETAMRAGGADWRMMLLGGVVHSYTNPEADRLGRPEFARYDARADARTWRMMAETFEEAFA